MTGTLRTAGLAPGKARTAAGEVAGLPVQQCLYRNETVVPSAGRSRQIMKIDEHAIEILHGLVPKARYEGRGQSITGTDYRNAWNSSIPSLSRGWLLTKVTPPEGFDKLVDILRLMLEPFVTSVDGKERVRTNISLIAASVGIPTELDDFARDVLSAAVLIGPDRTIELLRSWSNGEPIRYTRFTVLSGIRIEGDQEQFPVEEGLTIRSLPTSQDRLLALGAPEMWAGSPLSVMPPSLGGPDIYGTPTMVMEMSSGPVFSPADGIRPDNRSVATGVFGFNDPSLQGLTLACDSPVSPLCGWSMFAADVQSFVPWARFTPNGVVLFGGDGRNFAPSSVLTRESLAQAIDLAHSIVEHGLGHKTRTALDRWTKSLQGDFADRFIDLRIALEALYAPDGGSGEVSYRLQTRCARHMATSFNDRMGIVSDVKDFYNTASRFAHGDLVVPADKPTEPKHVRQLERAQQICRDALIKIVKENRSQDIDVNLITLA